MQFNWEVQMLLRGRIPSEEEAWHTICRCLTPDSVGSVVRTLCLAKDEQLQLLRIVQRVIA